VGRSFLGKFVDGNGRSDEERTYPSNEEFKYIYSVRATKKGIIELISIPEGVTDAKNVQRHTLTVMGLAPQPPPDVVPVTPPDVVPVNPPKGLRVMMLFNEDATREVLTTVNSAATYEWLNLNCAKGADGRPEWRKWDRTSMENPEFLKREDPVWKTLYESVKSQLPQGAVVVIAADTKVHIFPVGSIEATLRSLNKVKEGGTP
jgi:hypothetical protein